MAWLYVPGWEGSNSASTSPNLRFALSVTWRGSLRPPQFWQSVWQKENFLRPRSGVTWPPLNPNPGVERWISFLPGSRVSPLRSQGGELAPPTADGSGHGSRRSFAWFDPGSSSWRTSQGSLVPGMDSFSGPWPRSGLMLRGECFPQADWAPPTAASGSSISGSGWGTPTVHGNHNREGTSERARDGLSTQAKRWATPDASVSSGYNQSPSPGAAVRPCLGGQARRWPTPCRADGEGGPGNGTREGGNNLRTEAALCEWESGHQDPRITTDGEEFPDPSGLLNPRFVAWLMGFPTDWTNFGPSETASFLSWLESHTEFLRIALELSPP